MTQRETQASTACSPESLQLVSSWSPAFNSSSLASLSDISIRALSFQSQRFTIILGKLRDLAVDTLVRNLSVVNRSPRLILTNNTFFGAQVKAVELEP